MTAARYERLKGGVGLQRLRPMRPGECPVLCFPHGGGSAHTFAPLGDWTPDGYAAIAVDPPGRPRTGGAPLAHLADLVDLYARRIPADLLGGVLLGHSVGGYVAAALAARLAVQGRPARAVVVAAAVPAHFLDPGRPLSRMSDEERLRWCRSLGTLPGSEDDGRVLFELFADAIRADCAVYESARDVAMGHDEPMLVLGGDEDPVCPAAQIAGWRDTHPRAVVTMIPAGHMIPRSAPRRFTAEVAAFLAGLAPVAPMSQHRVPRSSLRPASGTRRRMLSSQRVASPYRWEDMWLRSRDGQRRLLPVLAPRGDGTPARLADVLAIPELLGTALAEHGAILARGWQVVEPGHLQSIVELHGGGLSYAGGDSPRTRLGPGVYTSTDLPADSEITPHNELSYAANPPERIFFACVRPAGAGGATLLADGRRTVAHLAPSFVRRLREHGVRYIRVLPDRLGAGRSWQATFETTDRDRVAEIVASTGAEATWLPDGALRIVEHRPALVPDYRTGEQTWFNQAEQWHPSALPADVRTALLDEFGPSGLPHDATYGDGEPFMDDDLRAVRVALAYTAVGHGWRRGDVLVLDNLTTLHGRAAYRGERAVLVAMTGSLPAVHAPT
ncbi:alpha/beta fold hydrolase [Frankia sp. Cj5]|uniref:alpha/beta fold hydrolase n=1 Tax=Frankia sp. Cj5 TaxID=2880978 RepID=UPI001EF6BE3A|nr:alpha/beta fold hydrolase [Frankia sp. Cj5]